MRPLWHEVRLTQQMECDQMSRLKNTIVIFYRWRMLLYINHLLLSLICFIIYGGYIIITPSSFL